MTESTAPDPLLEFRDLPSHGDSMWPHVVPGRWEPMTCEEYEAATQAGVQAGDLTVWSALTDPDGDHGRPEVFTCWGSRDDTVPGPASLALYAHGDRRKVARCIHARYVPEVTR